MAVKVIAKPQNSATKTFPKLMICDDNEVVLFRQPMQGVIVYSKSSKNGTVGHFSSSWDMQLFTDYNEPITIQND
jgi:hypothetical protein